jgi:hypothetical protein
VFLCKILVRLSGTIMTSDNPPSIEGCGTDLAYTMLTAAVQSTMPEYLVLEICVVVVVPDLI